MGARILRDYAVDIGLDPAFTIHDREDSADLMNLVRHELGLSGTDSRFPTKGTCLSIYSRAVNMQADIARRSRPALSLVRGWADELKQLFAAYVEAKQAQNVLDYDDLLLWWAQMCDEPAIAAHLGALRPHPRRRVPGHQPPPGVDPAGAQAGGQGADGGRRRRPVDLFVPGRRGAQHPRLSGAFPGAGPDMS
jgi:superfamily I DNA/RNA helicase